jgi:hypothetical protein
MTRFDEVARLKELEKKATPVKWYKAEDDEGDCDEINGSIQGWETGVMVYDRELGIFHPTKEKLRVSESEYEEVDNLLTVCSPEQESDANLIAELRNASHWLLEVAGCFQKGDAHELEYLLLDTAGRHDNHQLSEMVAVGSRFDSSAESRGDHGGERMRLWILRSVYRILKFLRMI